MRIEEHKDGYPEEMNYTTDKFLEDICVTIERRKAINKDSGKGIKDIILGEFERLRLELTERMHKYFR